MNNGTVHLSYNSRNFVTKRTDGEGYTNRWFYDRMGNLTSYYPAGNWEAHTAGYEYLYNLQERRVDTISPLGSHHRLFRNFDGNITRESHLVSYKEKGEDGEGTRYEYDWYGNPVKQVMPEAYDREKDDGSGYSYSYDPMGRMTRVEDPEGNGNSVYYQYNSLGRMRSRTD